MAQNSEQSSRESGYQPTQPDPLVCEQFKGVDTNTTRPGVPQDKMYWCDGFFPLSPRQLRTLPGAGNALWASPFGANTVVCFYFVNINRISYAVVFLTNGAIYYVNSSSGAGGVMFPAGTVTSPSIINVGVTSFSNQYVVIVAAQVNGYFVWDGTTGYVPGNTIPGVGVVPTGIGGTSIETYQGRIWLCNGPTVGFSAPGSIIDFTTASGGGNFTSTDSFLRFVYVRLIQSSGFLYLIGDSSINYISGVQTSGSPLVTTFTNQNSDPEVGTPYPASVVVYGRNIAFVNSFGAQVSYGSAVSKISTDLDGVFNSVPNFGGLEISAAKAIVFGKKVFVCLVKIVDPVSLATVNKLLMWDGKLWWAAQQDIGLTFITPQEVNSNISAWGTDGTSLYQLFQTPRGGITKTIQTKLWDAPGGYQFNKGTSRFFMLAQYNSPSNPTINLTVDSEVSFQSYTIPVSPGASTQVISVSSPLAVAQQGQMLGMTLTTNADDLSIISMMILPELQTYRG
jgi:hypothetical protein